MTMGRVETPHRYASGPVYGRLPDSHVDVSNAKVLAPPQFDKIVDRAMRDLALAKGPAEVARMADIFAALSFCAKRARLGLAAQNTGGAVTAMGCVTRG